MYYYGYGFDEEYYIGLIIGCIIWGVIWGAVAHAIGKSKGIKGFWWGFFLGIIGIIVVACMQPKQTNPGQSYVVQSQNNTQSSSGDDKYDKLKKLAELKDQGALTEEEFEKEKAKLL